MGFGSPLHWIVLMLVVVLLFGGGRISSLMGDVAKGIKAFKTGLAEDDDAKTYTGPQLVEKLPVDPLPAQAIDVRTANVPPDPDEQTAG